MARRVVIVVCDSLRRDLIDWETAPTLVALRDAATSFEAARGVFPSTTRVSAASLATGHSPAGHGLLGNTMALDEGQGLVCLSVGKPEFRERLRRATGRTLTAPTLAERLAGEGGAIAFSNVSPGAAYFLDPDGHGWIYHRAGSFAPGLAPVPAGEKLAVKLGAAGDRSMTDRFIAEVLEERRPALALLWLSEPDHSGHAYPLGSPQHRAGIAAADANVARVKAAVERLRAEGEEILLVVCSDHGMETTRQTIPLAQILVEEGLKADLRSADVVVAPNGTSAVLYLAPEAQDRTAGIAAFCRSQDWCAEAFAGDELPRVGLPAGGAAAVALTMAAAAGRNEHGVPGLADIVADPESAHDYSGCGQHGGLGRHEQSPFLFLDGGGFQPCRTLYPASLIDLAPTVLRHLSLPEDGLEGRALPFDPEPLPPSASQRRDP